VQTFPSSQSGDGPPKQLPPEQVSLVVQALPSSHGVPLAAVACWLASPLTRSISGQVVKVQGGVVQLLEGWRPLTEATADLTWTLLLLLQQLEQRRLQRLGEYLRWGSSLSPALSDTLSKLLSDSNGR
jgi:hypothetical protein